MNTTDNINSDNQSQLAKPLKIPVNITPLAIPKKSKLTLRERRLIKNLANPNIKTKQEAGIRAGYAKKNVSVTVSSKLKKISFISALHQALEKAGLTDSKLAEKFKELLEAKKVISANVIMKSGEGMKDADAMTKDFIEIADNDVQLRTATVIAKLKGHFIRTEEGLNLEINDKKIQNIQINFIKKESD